MLGVIIAESRRACVLIEALDAHEITLQEFAEEVSPLPSETLQVAATILGIHQEQERILDPRLTAARLICTQLACRARVLS